MDSARVRLGCSIRDPAEYPAAVRFPETQWSVVLRAGGDDRRAALGELCHAYWYPVYGFFRRLGAKQAEAPDLTQGFFASLLERGDFKRVDPELGRFRSWLRAAAKYFFFNQRDWEKAEKRGGKVVKVSIDAPGAEERLERELMFTLSPERLFDRCWARTVTERALSRFRAECSDLQDFERMREICDELKGQADPQPRTERPPKSGSERTRNSRQRAQLLYRYRRHLRREILGTVDELDAIDDEIRILLDVCAPRRPKDPDQN